MEGTTTRRLSTLAVRENSRVKLLVDQHVTSKQEKEIIPLRSDIEEVHSAVESLNQTLQETLKRNENNRRYFKSTRPTREICDIEESRKQQNLSSNDKTIKPRRKVMAKKKASTKKRGDDDTKNHGNVRELAGKKSVSRLKGSRTGDKSITVEDKIEDSRKKLSKSEQAKRRKLKLETEREHKLHRQSGAARRKRIKERAAENKKKLEKLRHWIIFIQMGAKLQIMSTSIMKYRAYQRQIQLEDYSAKVITRQMRIFKFKCYRKRVKGAVFVLGTLFVMKVKLWKRSRRRKANDIIRAFLVALDNENKKTNGCLAKVVIKCKKWRAYRQKIVILQRLWRDKMNHVAAQVLLIDLQWQKEQTRRTEEYVSELHKASLQDSVVENEKIDSINRTRKLIKLKPLPRRQHDSIGIIRNKISRGKDLLAVDHIIPAEIREGLIRDMLRHLRRENIIQQQKYVKALANYHTKLLRIQQQRAILVSFSGSEVANKWVHVQHTERRLSNSLASCAGEPRKPRFRVILQKPALDMLIDLGNKYVRDIRNSWEPGNFEEIEVSHFDGKAAADVHLQQNDCG